MKANYHHSALRKGYLPVTLDGMKEYYNGKFGEGFIECHANLRCRVHGKHSTNYYVIDYYIYS